MTDQLRGHYEERLWEARPGAIGGRRNRRAFTYEAFVPDPIVAWDPTLRADAVTAVTDATTAVAHLNDGPPRLESLAGQLLRAESLASSRIEGLELSHRRLAQAAFSGDKQHDPTAQEVVGNIAAMRRAIEIASTAEPFTPTHVVEVHRTRTRFTVDRRIADILRTTQNWIGRDSYTPRDADYIPPPPEYVDRLLVDLCEFMNRTDLPALVQAAVVHAQFETIHPFADGNGRVGRCLIHAVLTRRALTPRYVPPISLILATQAKQYVQGLVDFRDGRVDAWVEAFADAVAFAAADAERLADDIAALQANWLARMGNPRADSSAYKLIAALPAQPVIDVPTAQGIAGVSDVAAGRALNAMEQAGILTKLEQRTRNRAWECRELFDVANEFERDLATPAGEALPVRAAPQRSIRPAP